MGMVLGITKRIVLFVPLLAFVLVMKLLSLFAGDKSSEFEDIIDRGVDWYEE